MRWAEGKTLSPPNSQLTEAGSGESSISRAIYRKISSIPDKVFSGLDTRTGADRTSLIDGRCEEQFIFSGSPACDQEYQIPKIQLPTTQKSAESGQFSNKLYLYFPLFRDFSPQSIEAIFSFPFSRLMRSQNTNCASQKALLPKTVSSIEILFFPQQPDG